MATSEISDEKKPADLGEPLKVEILGDNDDRDMARMGKKQEFQRNFNWISSVGFTSCTMGTWEFVALNNFQMLVDGGTAGMFWSYCWVILGQFFIVLSLAEMSSMAPTAGGQYHWVSEFASKKYQKVLSYTSGWLSSLCWQSFVASDCMFAAQLLMALAQIHDPNFVIKNWYTALLSILIATIVTSVNVWGATKLALFENVFVALHVASYFVVIITICVTSPKNDAREVFTTFTDNGGNYPLMGLAVMVGQVPAMWNVLASDAVAHLSEEVRNASEVTPKTMFWAYMLNIPLAFGMLIAFLFCMTDVATATTEAFPFVWILQNSLSPAGAQAITAILFILVLMIAISCFASTSRQLFAFARDDGMPFSTWMKKVNPRLKVAANSCFVTWGYSVVMSLVYLGSPIAFNAIISLAIVALMATYAISIGCVLWRRLTLPETLPPVFWSLHRWGVAVNGIGLAYAVFAFFWAFWPIYWEPNAEEMNFAIVLFAGVMLISAINYFVSARRKYKGPVATCEGRQEDY
ncbi:amino acid transporter [Exophiala viscosa]|uniref:Amino acid transporter n=1 Tax=Exophiala viscosa TaxID=2486360 RepID=A0AAN6DNU8_9EURO|nr:amino acid transporter [Exophiala viscosa]